MSHEPAVPGERDRRIAELEKKLSKPSAVGVLPPVALIGLGVAAFMLYGQRFDIAYAMSSQDPLELGAEGDYRFGSAVSNRYARVHGIPTSAGTYWQERASTFVAVGLRDTPLLVARVLLPTESWTLGEKPPRPDQRAFGVKGRLLARADAAKYEDAFVKHEAFKELDPKWILIAEERPGGDLGTNAWTGFLAAFGLFNAWLFARGLFARFRR